MIPLHVDKPIRWTGIQLLSNPMPDPRAFHSPGTNSSFWHFVLIREESKATDAAEGLAGIHYGLKRTVTQVFAS